MKIEMSFEKPTCEYEYLPDEDGTVYHCGSDDNVTYLDGYFSCQDHLKEYNDNQGCV